MYRRGQPRLVMTEEPLTGARHARRAVARGRSPRARASVAV